MQKDRKQDVSNSSVCSTSHTETNKSVEHTRRPRWIQNSLMKAADCGLIWFEKLNALNPTFNIAVLHLRNHWRNEHQFLTSKSPTEADGGDQ
jgi:hypothetical protein